MAFQRERLQADAFVPSWVRHEHHARYAFASGYCGGKAVVDCACGDGAGSAVFAGAGAASVRAFDASEETIAGARARAEGSNVHFAVAPAGRLPLQDACADVYVCLETIEHVEDDKALLSEAARVLKPDGIFLCSTPNRIVTNPGMSAGDKPWNRFHVREYSRGEFAGLLDLDPWLFSCLFEVVDGVDINVKADQEKLAESAAKFIPGLGLALQ